MDEYDLPLEEEYAPRGYNYFGAAALGALLAVIGWGGLVYLMATIYPNGQTAADALRPEIDGTWSYLADADSGTLLTLSVLLVMAFTSISLPFTWFLNRRFSRNGLARPWTMTRQALWVGVFVAILAWLRANSTFSVAIMLITAGALALVELLMLLRQRGGEA